MKIRIEQPDTDDRVITCWGTKVFSESGEEIKDISRLSVDFGCPKTGEHIVMATIEMAVNPSTIHAHAILGVDSLKEAAEHHGYRLVEREKVIPEKPKPDVVWVQNGAERPPPPPPREESFGPRWAAEVTTVMFAVAFLFGLHLAFNHS